MSYEDAPATTLLAIACACCGRPLVDSVSVEAGVGPDCRARYGYARAEGAPDFDACASIFDGVDDPLVRRLPFGQQREFANLLVHRVAADPTGPIVGRCVAAVWALGFRDLAKRLAGRLGAVEVVRAGEDLEISTSRRLEDEAFAGYRSALAGLGRWDAQRKVNVVPASRRADLWERLRRCMPRGTLVVGERVAVV